jgi:repressor LexA
MSTIIQDLTTKQRNVLLFIQNRVKAGGIPPTIREIAQNFGFASTGTVRDYLRALTKKGYLNIEPKKSRHIELKRHAGFKLPILGQVMAGMPNIAMEETEGHLDLDDFAAKPDREVFCLKIKGDSLKDLGIFEGDLALVRKQSLAQDKDLVVALMENEATVKIFRHKQNKLWLEAANKKYPPLHRKFSILGRVFAILKQF